MEIHVRGHEDRSAYFSPCKQYRYALWRMWGGITGYAMFVGLNPSTADATTDDRTVRRCIGFARAWGYSGLCMTNLFAFRATDPRIMQAEADPIGPDTDAWLCDTASQASLVVAAWGVHGVHRGRDRAVLRLLEGYPLMCLGLTRDGNPRHPLFMPNYAKPMPYRGGQG